MFFFIKKKLEVICMAGQASMEYILLVGFSLVIVGFLWVMASNNLEDTQWEIQLAQAQNSIEKIAQTADVAYVQGVPSQIYINVNFPENTHGVYIVNNSITIELWWKGLLRNVTTYSTPNLTGALNAAPGGHRVLVTAGPQVDIQEA